MYPPDSVVHLLKPGPGVDQLPSVSTVMSSNIISTKQTCLQWTCTSFSPPKPLPLLPSPPLSACLHINYCDMQVAKGHAWARNMHDLGLSKFLEVILVGYNWWAKGVVLIITFFCIIYRYFWLSMLVPSFFTCSCTHILLLSMVQQQQANLMLLLQRAKKVSVW